MRQKTVICPTVYSNISCLENVAAACFDLKFKSHLIDFGRLASKICSSSSWLSFSSTHTCHEEYQMRYIRAWPWIQISKHFLRLQLYLSAKWTFFTFATFYVTLQHFLVTFATFYDHFLKSFRVTGRQKRSQTITWPSWQEEGCCIAGGRLNWESFLYKAHAAQKKIIMSNEAWLCICSSSRRLKREGILL